MDAKDELSIYQEEGMGKHKGWIEKRLKNGRGFRTPPPSHPLYLEPLSPRVKNLVELFGFLCSLIIRE